jgi:poly(ADP-ribose) glycohydrolase ARH3
MPSAGRDPRSCDAQRGALLGTFVGDALGMPFEGVPPERIPARVEMVEARRGRGTYTDDTQMMIALAESLAECGRVDPRHLARAFGLAYEPDRGYGGGTRRVLELWASGVSVEDASRQIFGGQGSRGNGAAMRIAPIAVRFADEPRRLVAEAARSALVTHAHAVGVDAALAQAAAIGAALRREPILDTAAVACQTAELRAALSEVEALLAAAPEPAEVHARLGSSSDAAESVPAAIYAAVSQGTFEDAVRFAVRVGGDTDTVAAMAGAIAGARFGASAIPQRWLDGLEDGQRGRRYVDALAVELAAPRRQGPSSLDLDPT